MAGPSGFMQRWQGKVLAKSLWVGSGGLTATGSTNASGNININANSLASLTGLGTFNGDASTASNIASYGITHISTAVATYNLDAPVRGRRALLYTDALGDGARKVSSTGAGATFVSTLAGAAFLNFSTVADAALSLLGLSTASWLIVSNVNSGVTVSTA